MNKNNFKNLLTDLYNIYNPANLDYIDDLVERYSRLEFDALKNIFFKYNRQTSSFYDPEIGTDQHILDLIKEYNNGSRKLQNIKEQEVIESSEKEEIKEDSKKEIVNTVDKKNKQSLKQKEDEFLRHLEKICDGFEKKLSTLTKDEDDVTIRIFSTHTNTELDLPNKKIIAGLGKGSRLIIKDKDGKTVGMEIVDITYDGVSELNGKALVEIFVNKV